MSELNCEACNELQEYAPDFIDYGVTDEIAASLSANTGLNPNLDVLHEDCEDLNDANDCLIGMLPNTVESYKVCDWQEFMLNFLGNLYNLLKAMIASICGLWTKLEVASYYGIAKLYTDTTVYGTSGATPQTVAFNHIKIDGNMPSGVFAQSSGYTAITITNSLSAPILVNTTFNCSMQSDQHISCCYIVITRDGHQVGQTPFITPSTYDQQVMAEPFILQPGQSTVMSYYFAIGAANSYYISQFGGTGAIQCVLEHDNVSDPRGQGSYFIVQATTVVAN